MIKFCHGYLCEGAVFMKIQAVNNAINCQPLRNVDFGRKKNAPIIIVEPVTTPAGDSFTPPPTAEQKYNFACLLAAYYKTQYENLLKSGCCEA